jgi:hypothetical protein
MLEIESKSGETALINEIGDREKISALNFKSQSRIPGPFIYKYIV